jgi:hypothetical protein
MEYLRRYFGVEVGLCSLYPYGGDKKIRHCHISLIQRRINGT